MTTSTDEPRGQMLSRGAFALVIGLLIVRSLLLEVVRDAGPAVANAPPGPGATTSLVLDWLSLLPMLLVIARRFVDRSFTLRGGAAHVFLLTLAIWAMLSTIWADDRFIAFVSSTRLLAAASLFWTTTQLVRRWDHLRLIAGVLVGLLLANVAHGLITQFVDQPDLRAFWGQTKQQFFQQRGWTADTYEAQRFELKLLADEFFGFNASPNTLGAIVVMFAIVAIAAAIQRFRDRDPIAWPIALVLAAASSLFLLAHISSKAAVGAFVLGGALLGLWAIARRLLARQRLVAFAVGIALIGLAVVSVMGVGLLRGGLPTDSLNFRWRYWVGAWRIVLAHPTVGVGWANFAEHYLPVRLPQAAEEIQDPHDFAVRVTAELGAIGLTLLLAWLLSYAWRVTRPIELRAERRASSSKAVLGGIVFTLVGAWLVNLVAADDVTSLDNSAFLLIDGFKRLLFVGLIGAGIALVLLRRDADESFVADDRPAPWILVGLVIAIALMLVQSTIDIALFQIAPLMLVASAAGATLGIGWRDRAPRRESIPLIAISAASMLTIAFLVAGVVPIGVSESRAADGAAALVRKAPDIAGRAYAAAYGSTYPLNNVDYAAHAAEAFTGAGLTHIAEARHWLDVATQADPSNAQAWFTRARIGKYWFDNGVPGESPPDQICDAFARGIALNPSDAALQIEYADLLEHFGKREAAAAAIDEALRVDDALDPAEPERLELRHSGERDRLNAKRVALRNGTTSQP